MKNAKTKNTHPNINSSITLYLHLKLIEDKIATILKIFKITNTEVKCKALEIGAIKISRFQNKKLKRSKVKLFCL